MNSCYFYQKALIIVFSNFYMSEIYKNHEHTRHLGQASKINNFTLKLFKTSKIDKNHITKAILSYISFG